MDRQRFYDSLRAMLSVSVEPLLVDQFPPTDVKNVSANILRKGLAISAFSSLESYIGQRFGELIAAIGACRFGYSELPLELKTFLTVDAITGLNSRIGFVSKSERLTYVETAIQGLSAFSATPPSYTAFGFSPRGSNVSGDDVAAAFKVFGVHKPWHRLSTICSTIGENRLALADDYLALSTLRNQSAHIAQSILASGDLVTHLRGATALGISMDILLSIITDAFRTARSFVETSHAIATSSPKIRFIDQETSGQWVERAQLLGRIVKRYATEDAAVLGAQERSGSSFVICRDASRIPVRLV